MKALSTVIDRYQKIFKLFDATFTLIDHVETIVALVFRVEQPNKKDLILKICSRKGDFFREKYFLTYFSDKIKTARIVELVEPMPGLDGAILMESLQGELFSNCINTNHQSNHIAYEAGLTLALIHQEKIASYGDLTDLDHLHIDPRIPFTQKFEEGINECWDHLPKKLTKRSLFHFHKDLDLLLSADGPCIIHRDYRPGNLIVNDQGLQGVIDWSSARGGIAEEDLLFFLSKELSDSLKDHFLAGYKSIRPVPLYQRIKPLLQLSRAIATVGFTVKRDIYQTKGKKLYQSMRAYLETLA